jgi:multimeric flavodoxin WrbA
MNLLIHDLNDEEWKELSAGYDGWEIISDNGSIKPCVGCFGCWIKEPGECVIKDGYEKMGALIHRADEIKVISRYTYGGFSSFVKNVFDRSIGWVLPYFEVYENEMHHKKRYPEDKPITFIFRGEGLTDEDKKKAEVYVEAVCRNLRGYVKSIMFEEIKVQATDTDINKEIRKYKSDPEKTVMINCSLRGDKANSRKFLDRLSSNIREDAVKINLSAYLNRKDELMDILGQSGKIIFSIPLYVDGIPSACLRVMEEMEKYGFEGNKHIYVVSNMGLYESSQLKNLMSMVKSWCGKCGFIYGGGVAIGAGEMIGSVMASTDKGPAKNATDALDKLADAIDTASIIKDNYVDPYRFPRCLYIFAANSGWPKAGKLNGLKKVDLLQQKS